MIMALRPSAQQERLRTVQRAAQYVLALTKSDGALTRATFGTMDVFPQDLGVVEGGHPDYNWRSQLAWTWSQAGYLHKQQEGKGLRKHWEFWITPLGRLVFPRIASDPAIASFYISHKRQGVTEIKPAAWYQAPELRTAHLAAVEIPPSFAAFEAEDDPEAGGDAGEEQEPDVHGAPDDALSSELTAVLKQIPTILTQSIDVLVGLKTQIATIERSVETVERAIKEQSDLVLETATKLDAMTTSATSEAPTAAFGRASAEIAQSVSKALGDSGAAVRSLTTSLDKLAEDVAGVRGVAVAIQTAQSEIKPVTPALPVDVRFDETHLVLSITSSIRPIVIEAVRDIVADEVKAALSVAGAGLGAVVAGVMTSGTATMRESLKLLVALEIDNAKKSLVDLAMKEQMARDKADADREVRFAKIMKGFTAAVDAVEERFAMLDGDVLDDLKTSIESMTDKAENIETRLETVADHFYEGMATWKEQISKLNNTAKTVVDGAEMLLEAGRYVTGEMMSVAYLHARITGVSSDAVREKGDDAAQRLDVLVESSKRRVSALGSGLIRPEGSPVGGFKAIVLGAPLVSVNDADIKESKS